MKKKVWPVLLVVVLVFGLAMMGCGGDNPSSKHQYYEENPVAEGAKFIRITERKNSWDTIDIAAGQDGNTGYTYGENHIVTIYGKTRSGTMVTFSRTNEPYTDYDGASAISGSDGMFTLGRTFTWAELTNPNYNIRVNIPAGIDYDLYEIIIVDADGDTIYKMSEDYELQNFLVGVKDGIWTTWLKKFRIT